MDTTHRSQLSPSAVAACRAALEDAGAPGGHITTGAVGEALAADHLVDDGLLVIARNWRLRAGELRGELDLVALDDTVGCVVVCEVKARRDAGRFGGALAAVSARKRAKVRTLTAAFLREASLAYPRVRLDLIAVDLGERPVLTHLEAAL